MKERVMKLALCGTILALMVTACSSPAGVAPPDIVDTWQPPEGVEATPPLSCDKIGGLFAYDATAPLDIQEEKRRHEDGVTITDFNYASPRGGRVPAELFVPDGPGPFAGMVFMHGSGGDRYSMRWLASAYARLGVVGIAVGAPSSRPAHGDLNFVIFREQDAREQIQLIVDLRRAVDILVARPDVDPQRLAYQGISYGGAMGGLLAGVEHRLQGYVLQVGDGGLVTHFSGSRIMGLPEQVRREWLAAMWPIESLHYVGCAAPAALLFQNGTLDTMVPPADALRYQRAGSEPKTIRWYEADHGLNLEAYQDQAEWLRARIGIASYRMAYPFSLRIALIAWFLLTLVSLALVIVALWRMRPAPRGARLLWLLTTALLGPLGLAAYWISCGQSGGAQESAVPASPARRALGSAAWAAAGNVSGLIIFLGLILHLPIAWYRGGFVGIAEILLAAFCVGWLIFAAARSLSRFDGRFAAAYRRPALAEVASTCLVCAAAFAVVNTLIMRVFGNWASFGFDLTYAPLWGSFSLAALAGTLVTYPLHLWLLRRGVIRWGGYSSQTETTSPSGSLSESL
jgi:dienelactone hydrolase